jgi:hypothetical protein
VSGRPASGKTTLALALARGLGLPLISRDPISEALADALGRPSRELGNASFAIFWRLLHEQVEAGIGAVGETNLHRGVSEPGVRALMQDADVRLVHCQTPCDVSIRRFRERFEQGRRHWCFEDGRRLQALAAGEADPCWERAQPLELGLRTLVVDTTNGYRPELEVILEFLRTAADGTQQPQTP